MNDKNKIPLEVGDNIVCSKTITETDVSLFAGITGDFNRAHVNEQYMKTTHLGTRIAHGALTFAVASTTQTTLLSFKNCTLMCVSLGYEKVRFVKPVFFGDTLTTTYTIIEVNQESMRTRAKQETINQHGEVVCVSEHLWKFFSNPE